MERKSRAHSAPFTVSSAPGLLGLLSYLARPASDFQSRDISRRTRTTPPSRGRVRRKDVFSPARATQSEAQRCRYSDISPSKTRHGGILRAWNRPEPPMGSLMAPRAAQNTLCGGGNPRAIQLYKMTSIRNQKNKKRTRTLTEFELCHVHTCHVCIYCAITQQPVATFHGQCTVSCHSGLSLESKSSGALLEAHWGSRAFLGPSLDHASIAPSDTAGGIGCAPPPADQAAAAPRFCTCKAIYRRGCSPRRASSGAWPVAG